MSWILIGLKKFALKKITNYFSECEIFLTLHLSKWFPQRRMLSLHFCLKIDDSLLVKHWSKSQLILVMINTDVLSISQRRQIKSLLLFSIVQNGIIDFFLYIICSSSLSVSIWQSEFVNLRFIVVSAKTESSNRFQANVLFARRKILNSEHETVCFTFLSKKNVITITH